MEMRARAFDGVQKSVAFTDLPAAVKIALAAAEKTGLDQISQAPYFGALVAPMTKDQELAKLRKSLDASAASFSQGDGSKLAAMRAGLFTALARHPKVSYFFGTLENQSLDYEKDIVGILLNTVSNGTKATHSEQVAAAKSLKSYQGRLNGDPAIIEAVKDVTQARLVAKNAQDRDNAEELLGILSK